MNRQKHCDAQSSAFMVAIYTVAAVVIVGLLFIGILALRGMAVSPDLKEISRDGILAITALLASSRTPSTTPPPPPADVNATIVNPPDQPVPVEEKS